MSDILLTIAIPTYNRSYYLNRCLKSICTQLDSNNEKQIELIVSDNASTDDTPEVVQQYISSNYKINYIVNAENKGSDFNIIQCYNEAKGKYIVAFGDDDVFVTGAITTLINVLQEKERGLIYMKHYSIDGQFIDKPVLPENAIVNNYTSKADFLKKVTYYTTFISGNIINRNVLGEINVKAGMGTNLAQVPVILKALDAFENNAIIETDLFAMQTGNTGGYGLFETFAKNYSSILDETFKSNRRFKEIIVNDMLMNFFPFWIHNLKRQHTFSKEKNLNALMLPLFRGYVLFWIFNYPLINLGNTLSGLYYKMIKMVYRINRIMLNNKR